MNEKLHHKAFDKVVERYKETGGTEKPVFELSQFQVRYAYHEQRLRVVLCNARGTPFAAGTELVMVPTKSGNRSWKNA